MKWLVTLKRVMGEQIDFLPWEIEDAPDKYSAKEAAEAEAAEEEILDFFAEEAEVILD